MKKLTGHALGAFMMAASMVSQGAMAQLPELPLPPPPSSTQKQELPPALLPKPPVPAPLPECGLKGKFIGLEELRPGEIKIEDTVLPEYFNIVKYTEDKIPYIVDTENLSFAVFEHETCPADTSDRYSVLDRHSLSEAVNDASSRNGLVELEELVKAEDAIAHYRCTPDERIWVEQARKYFPKSMAMCPPEM